MTTSKMNFYTQNGWAGSNYDSKLQTKDVAAKVRAYAKKNFPEFKFSVTSRWSMYTDSLYIVLKSGPCVPFIEGSRSAERGYMQTMSSVKGWESDLTPEVFAALDGVTSYAASFRYDDSDGIIDYFDTNFFLKIEIADDYKVIETKHKKKSPKQGEPSKEANEVKASNPVVTVEGLEIVDYSEKAIAVFGDTKTIKDELKKLGGKFNPALNHNGEKRAGWIFSKKQADKVRALLAPSVETVESVTLPELPKEIDITDALDEMEKRQETTPKIHQRRGKSLQDIVNQTMRINGYAGINWYWNFNREKLISKIYSHYVTNIYKLGGLDEPNKRFTREEYKGITPAEAKQDTDITSKANTPSTAERDVRMFEQSDIFFKIVKRLRENIKKGHAESTVKKNIKSLHELVHNEFFRSVTVPYFSKHPSINKIDNGVVTEFLRRADKLSKGDDVENDLSKISRFSSIYCTCEEIGKEINERAEFAKASKEFIQEWRKNNPYPGSEHLDEFNAKFNRDYSEFADKHGVFSYMVPSIYPIERGEYKETELDAQKKAADILVESIDGNWYTIRLNRQIELKSKRIRKYDNGCIAVPESVYNKLKDKYNVMCNF